MNWWASCLALAPACCLLVLVWRARKEVGREMWSPLRPQPLDWRVRGPDTPRLLELSSRMSALRCRVLPRAATRLLEHLEELQWAGSTTVYEDGHHRHDSDEPTTEEVDCNKVWGNRL